MALSVEDNLAIQQLYARYNHSIDMGKAADWAACFTPTGVFDSGAQGRFEGTDALVGFATGFSAQLTARHWINNLMIDGDGGGATGTCYLQLLRLQAGKPASPLATGIYVDALTKADGAWKFTNRTVNVDQI